MNTPKPIDAIVAGHLCLDIRPEFSEDSAGSLAEIFVPGKLINMSAAVLSTGGAVSNTGLTLARLGLTTRLAGKVGVDPFASIIRLLLAQDQADSGLITDPAASTSYSVVIAPPGVDRIFLHHPGANDTFGADDLPTDMLQQARLLHFGYPPLMRRFYENEGRELAQMFHLAKQYEVTTSLDLALPDPASDAGKCDWNAILSHVLPNTDVFLPSIEELAFMLDRAEFDRLKANRPDADLIALYDYGRLPALADRLLAAGAAVVMIKIGRFGFYLRTASSRRLAQMGSAMPTDIDDWADRELMTPPLDVPFVASTSGAGDACIAGFLSGLLRDQDPVTACLLGSAVAALKIQTKGSVGGTLPFEQTRAMLDGWAAMDVAYPVPGWYFDSAQNVWIGPRDRKA